MSFRPHRNSSTTVLLTLVVASLFALTTGVSRGQQGQPSKEKAPASKPLKQRSPETVARIETELVQIDVVVTDKAGKLVGDLKREDFQIFEDNKPQEITHFAVGNSTQPAVWLDTERQRAANRRGDTPGAVESHGRFIVLALDDLHLSPGSLMYAKRTMKKFVRDQLSGGDQTAIATTSGSLGLLQQFTSDRTVLDRAIDRLTVRQMSGMTPLFDVPQISDYQAELIDMGDHDALELAIQEILRQEPEMSSPPPGQGGGGRGGASGVGEVGGMSPRELAAQRAKSKARMMVAENANWTSSTLGSIEGIVRSLRDVPGRKIVVLVSDGFYMGGTSNSKHFDIRKITDAATRSGVVIYSLDARGLIATPPGGDASQPSPVDVGLPGVRSRIESSAADAKRDGMNALASDTGGFLVLNTNDLNAGIQRVLDENETYYVVAWEPATSFRDGRFRRIQVKLPGRPELRVRSRKGYFSPDDKETEEKLKTEAVLARKAKEDPTDKAVQKVRESQIRAGLTSLFPVRAIPVELAADYVDTAEMGQVAIVTAHIDADTLSFGALKDGKQSLLDVVTLVFDEKGKIAGNLSERLNLNLKPQLFDQVRRNGFTYRKLVPLKPGFHQVRLAIREEGSGLVGSATRWVEIPDPKLRKLTLSSVLLTTSLKDVQTAASVGYQPQPTQALRRFAIGTDVDFLLFAYNAQLKDGRTDLVLQTQVFSGSKLIYSSPLSKIPSEGAIDIARLPYAARLSLTGFEPGDYELRVVVIDRTSKQSADRRANFTVLSTQSRGETETQR
ncbi:MAG: VWA domain-containing protein [Acidobacteriota bacterium]